MCDDDFDTWSVLLPHVVPSESLMNGVILDNSDDELTSYLDATE
jgi:hypothetical protein